MHEAISDPSPWVVAHGELVAPGGTVLDLACGGGRHARFFAARGHPVTAVDINIENLTVGEHRALINPVAADLESGPWPLPDQRFAGVVVTNYLWRPILPQIVRSVADGGVLIYATFAEGNEQFGKPSNPDFLLRPNELLNAVISELTVLAFDHGYRSDPNPAMRQRIVAQRPAEI